MPGYWIEWTDELSNTPQRPICFRGGTEPDVPALASAARSSSASKWPFPSFDPGNHQETRVDGWDT